MIDRRFSLKVHRVSIPALRGRNFQCAKNGHMKGEINAEGNSSMREEIVLLFKASFLCMMEIRKIFYKVAFVREKMT